MSHTWVEKFYKSQFKMHVLCTLRPYKMEIGWWRKLLFLSKLLDTTLDQNVTNFPKIGHSILDQWIIDTEKPFTNYSVKRRWSYAFLNQRLRLYTVETIFKTNFCKMKRSVLLNELVIYCEARCCLKFIKNLKKAWKRQDKTTSLNCLWGEVKIFSF